MPSFPKLFEPVSIGNVTLKNRLVFLTTETLLTEQGHITGRLTNYYKARARGGAGLIIVGTVFPFNWDKLGVLRIHDDSFIPEFKRLVDAIHAYGTPIFAQVGMERLWRRSGSEPVEAVSPSGVAVIPSRPVRPLTPPEIRQIEDEHAGAVLRCGKAGFDGVEIHAGSGFVINQFMSAFTNKRVDEYGGSGVNRLRILRNLVEKARRIAGNDFPLTVKISGADLMDGGSSAADVQRMVPLIEDMGFAAINVAVGWHESPVPTVISQIPEGHWSYLAEGIKKVARVPVISTYRITSPQTAEKILAEGKADMIGMARGLIADPDLPNLAEEGKPDDIRSCIACCLCLDRIFGRKEVQCSVNPLLGREKETELREALVRKKVVIIGGGPAGMEAARVAALRGHRVTLFEKNRELGGQLIPAAVPPHKSDINNFTEYLKRQLNRLGVEVRTGVEADMRLISKEAPDAVILAAGAVPGILRIPGARSSNVFDPVEVLTGKTTIGGERVTVIGGGYVGCETADYLASGGKKVIITTRQEKVGHGVGVSNRWALLSRLRKNGVKMEPGFTPEEITPSGTRGLRDGKEVFFESDAVIISGGMKPLDSLENALPNKGIKFIRIGDCLEPRGIRDAVVEGFDAGMAV